MATRQQARTAVRLPFFRRGSSKTVLGWIVVGIIAALLPPIFSGSSQQQIVGDLVEAEVYAMLALGLNVVVGFAGLLDLGYAAFYAIGAYAFGLISSAHFQPNSSFSSPIISWGATGFHANFWIFLPLCALLAATFGVILGAPTLRLRGDYLAIVTLGFGEIVHKTVINLGPSNAFGWPDITGGDNSLSGIFQPQIAGLQFNTDQIPWYYLALVILGIIIVIAYSLQSSRLGRAWAAMREDELAAACMGINLTRTKLLAFSIGAFFSGFAGVVQGSRLTLVNPQQFTFTISISILVMVVLGGLGSVPGVVLGASLVALIQYYLLDELNTITHNFGSLTHINYLQNIDLTQAQYLIFGIMLVLMMLFRREGLLPNRQRRQELHPSDLQVQMEENQQLYTSRQEGE